MKEQLAELIKAAWNLLVPDQEEMEQIIRDKGRGPLVEPAPDAFPLHYRSPYISGRDSHAKNAKD